MCEDFRYDISECSELKAGAGRVREAFAYIEPGPVEGKDKRQDLGLRVWRMEMKIEAIIMENQVKIIPLLGVGWWGRS